MEKYFRINQNGLSICCKLYCADIRQIDCIVIFCHGFSGNKDNHMAQTLAKRIQKRHKEIALLIFDWPCHGDDAGNKIRLSDCARYIDTVLDYAKSSLHARELYASATSFGGYLILKYIAQSGNPFTRVTFRCPAVNMYDVLTKKILTDEELHTLHKGKPVLVGFEKNVKINSAFLSELKENDITLWDYRAQANSLKIIHGTQDEIVNYNVVQEFAAKNAIALHTVERADHRFTNPQKMEEAIKEILAFLLPEE